MKEWVLMNKETGSIGLGIKVTFFDREIAEPLASLDGYSVRLSHDSEFDMWGCFEGAPDATYPWMLVHKDFVESKCEVVCEL